MTNEKRPRTRLSNASEKERGDPPNTVETAVAAVPLKLGSTHTQSTLPWQPSADPPSSLPSPISPYSHFSYLLPYTFHQPPPSLPFFFCLVPTVSLLRRKGGPASSKDRASLLRLLLNSTLTMPFYYHFPIRWKSYDSATCGRSTISVSVGKKWEKFSNHRLSLPGRTISSSGECCL